MAAALGVVRCTHLAPKLRAIPIDAPPTLPGDNWTNAWAGKRVCPECWAKRVEELYAQD